MKKGKIDSKKYYIKKLDSFWSNKIRSLGICQRCGKKGNRLEMAHIISRNNKTLRWDEQNLLCLDTKCHFWAHQDPLGFSLFVQKNYPARYMYLMHNKNLLTKRTAKDLKEMLESLKDLKSKDI